MIKDIFDLYGMNLKNNSENYNDFVNLKCFENLTGNNRVVILIILLSSYIEGANYSDYSKQWTKSEKKVCESICLCGSKKICLEIKNEQNQNIAFLCSDCQIKFADAKRRTLSEQFGKRNLKCSICSNSELCYILNCKYCKFCQICKKNAINPESENICESCYKNIENEGEALMNENEALLEEKVNIELKIQLSVKKLEEYNNVKLFILSENDLKKERYALLEKKKKEKEEYLEYIKKISSVFENAVDISNLNQIKLLYMNFCNIESYLANNHIRSKFDEFLKKNVQKKEGYDLCIKCVEYKIPLDITMAYCLDCSRKF